MSDTHKRIRVFVGSPGDVAEERDAVSDVIERVNSDLDCDGVGLYFQSIRWEKYAHLRDTRSTPQAAIASGIPRPRDCDVAVFIFWRRIGTVLDMTGLEPNGAGDRPTGSTWEFYDALESDRTTVLTYRKTAPALAVRDESIAQFEERQQQEREVHQLFASLMNSDGGFKGYWHSFEHPAEFKADLRVQLGIIAKKVSRETEVKPAETPGSRLFPKPDLIPMPSRDFSISRHQITFEQYDYFAKETGNNLPDDNGWGRGDRPVINVKLAEAKTYAKWLSEQLGQEYRLPSTEEWEYAARAGGSGDYGLGEGGVEITQDNLGDYAWYRANSGEQTWPVGTRKPNAWGLYDMFGNVWEWCGDDGTICGGAWHDHPDALRASLRRGSHPVNRNANVGFRVVCVLHRQRRSLNATPERPHGLKYRLYCGREGNCLVRYDNEAGKGDHRHYGVQEEAYRFESLERLVADFREDCARLAGWRWE